MIFLIGGRNGGKLVSHTALLSCIFEGAAQLVSLVFLLLSIAEAVWLGARVRFVGFQIRARAAPDSFFSFATHA